MSTRLEQAKIDLKELDRLISNCSKRVRNAADRAYKWESTSKCGECNQWQGARKRTPVEPYATKHEDESERYHRLWSLRWELIDYIDGLDALAKGRPTIAAIRKAAK